jgi:alkylhydroperoxidase domain protein
MNEKIITYPDQVPPNAFTQKQLSWLPWLEPLPAEELTERHYHGLVDASRAKSPYFMLLARDPDILGARTRTDKDIFYNTAGGLPRAERELSAAATSRYNGCIYCASVHARFSSQFSKRVDDLERLLAEGVAVAIDPRWEAIIAASVALAATPISFGAAHVQRLREVGLADLEISDVIHGAAFFNWANRLMLSLGQPEGPV